MCEDYDFELFDINKSMHFSNQIKSNLYLNQAKAHTHRHTHEYTKHNIQ